MKTLVQSALLPSLLVLFTLASGEQARAQFGKPFDVTFVNETQGPVQAVITSPVREFLGNIGVNEELTVDFNRGEVVEFTQGGKLVQKHVVGKNETVRIRRAVANTVPPPWPGPAPAPAPEVPGPSGGLPSVAPPPPPGVVPVVDLASEARQIANYVNQIRANPQAHTRLHTSLGDADVKAMPALNWNAALQQAAQRKVNWMVQTGQSTHVMTINGQRVGMNQWMREAGYKLADYLRNEDTNFEVIYGASGSAAGIGVSAVNSFMSEGKDGGHVRPLLGRGWWKSCTDIGAAIGTGANGIHYVSVLVGSSSEPGSTTTPSTQNPVVQTDKPRSKRSDIQVNVTWKNVGSQPITLHWIDAAGNETAGGQTFQPGQIAQGVSYESHVFVFKQGGQQIQLVTLTAQPQQQYDIGKATADPKPPEPVVAWFDPTGDWQYADGSYQFSIRKTATGFEWVSPTGQTPRYNKGKAANRYQLAGAPGVTMTFKSEDAGRLDWNDRVIQLTRRTSNPPPSLPVVPSLLNLTKQAANTQLEAVGLKGNAQPGSQAPNASLNGKVYSQLQRANTPIAAGSIVTYHYYQDAAPPPPQVPDLAGVTQQVALQRVQQAGLRANAISGDEAPDASRNGLVYRQVPDAGATVAANSEVSYYFYKPAPVAQPVPNVVNQLKFHAEDALQLAGFSPKAQPGNATTDAAKIGIVYAQSVPAGTVSPRGTTVTVTYHTKQMQPGETIKAPWVIHMSRWDAEMRILNFGLVPQRNDIGPAPEPSKYGIVKGWDDQQQPRGEALVRAGSTLQYNTFENPAKIGPYDANSPNPIPDMIPAVNGDGSIDIAWTRKDGKSFYSRFSGNNWQQADHMPIPNALRYLAGMSKDEAGNAYIATMRQEFVREADWHNFRPDVPVAHLLKIAPGSRTAEFVVNLNQKTHVRHAITNPMNTDSAAFTSGRMAYGAGALFCAFGQNNAGHHSATGMFGVNTSGQSVSDGAAGQHPYEADVHFDGRNFVMVQSFEAGVACTKLTPNGDRYDSSGMKLVFKSRREDLNLRTWTWTDNTGSVRTEQARLENFENGELVLVAQNGTSWRVKPDRLDPKDRWSPNRFFRIGGIANTSSGYLLLLTFAESGKLGNYYPGEWVPPPATPARLHAVFVPKDFQTAPKFDFPGFAKYASRVLSNPPTGNSHVRPKLVDLGGGRYLVLCEERNPQSQYVTTTALIIDENGGVQQGPKNLPGARLHANNDAFRLPDGKAGWVSGDAANNRINLYVIDSSLNVQSHPLQLP